MQRQKALMVLGAMTGFIAAVGGGCAFAATDGAADNTVMRERQERFAAYQAAHPGAEAELARIKSKTAAMIAAYTPPPAKTGGLETDAAPVIWRTAARPTELWDGLDAPEMVVVPAGEYAMGSPVTEPNREAAESPLHRVRIGYALAISKYPITVGEFASFVADAHYDAGNRCYTSVDGLVWANQEGRGWRQPGFEQTNVSPAVCLNWNDAKAYAAFELKSRYPAVKTSACHDGYVFTSPVGSFKPNGFGLYDTAGNVWSWVEDCWNDTYASAPSDGSAWVIGDCQRHLLRGGSWYYYPRNLRAADRYGNATEPRVNMDGFRVALML